MTVASHAERAQSLRLMITTIMIAVAILGVVIFWLLGGTDAEVQPVVMTVFLAVTVVVALVMDRHWLRLPALTLDEPDPDAKAHEVFIAHSIVKFAIIEAVFMIAIVAGFLTETGWPTITTGLAVVAALAIVVWPSQRNVTRAATQLESLGVRTSLVEDYT